MPCYLYLCETHGEFELTHSIKEEVEFCPKCQEEGKEPQKLKRLIGATSFQLRGGGWASEGYK